MMNNKHIGYIINIAGIVMLAWFLFSTIRYFYSGMFMEELNSIPLLLKNGEFALSIYRIIQVALSTVGIIFLAPLLLRGHVGGLVVGILYWIMGSITNPLWYVFPRKMQVAADGSATSFLWGINIAFSLITLFILGLFYFYRRAVKLKNITW